MNLRLLIDRLNRAVASPASDQPRTEGMPPWLARQTQLLHRTSRPSYLAARELLEYPGYEAELTDARLRDDYLEALFTVARVLGAHGEDALKRAYSLDDGHVPADRDSSAKEAAANWLAGIYEKRQAHHTAVWWFRQSLTLARSVGVRQNILSNLRGLARNLNTLGNYPEAGPCYDEILRLLNDVPRQHRVSEGLAHAAMYQLEHGDHERGEAIMRELTGSAFGPSQSIEFGSKPIPFWFAAATHALVSITSGPNESHRR